jgi:hypothetical protein
MAGLVHTAGEAVHLDVASMSARAELGPLLSAGSVDADGLATVLVRQTDHVVADQAAVALRNACSSGLDLQVTDVHDIVQVVATRRRHGRSAALHRVLPARARLLDADVLLHYPAMWRAGWRGRVPLHAAALQVNGRGVLVVGASGVGKTTLAMEERTRGAHFVSDNLVVCDGVTAWGVLEPIRAAGGTGRRTTHGRRVHAVPPRRLSMPVELVVVLRRGADGPQVRSLAPAAAARELVAGTYGAGELRRYWGFAAGLALGTGRGPVHPAVESVAERTCRRVPCLELELGNRPGPHLSDALQSLEVPQWT